MGHAVHPVHEQIRAATFACGGDVSLRVYAAGECVNVFLRDCGADVSSFSSLLCRLALDLQLAVLIYVLLICHAQVDSRLQGATTNNRSSPATTGNSGVCVCVCVLHKVQRYPFCETNLHMLFVDDYIQ